MDSRPGPGPGLALSVLDQCPVADGFPAPTAVAHSLELAAAAESLGYRRYWVAEHHNTGSLACASPEILVAAAAARTSTIRVGSGGVLLSHYSPLKVAETFRLLEALHPGRIDLGVGRASGSDAEAEAALRYRPGSPGDDGFGERVVDLLAYLDDRGDRGDRGGGDLDDRSDGGPGMGGVGRAPVRAPVRAVPLGGGRPDVWILGSSSNGAAGAAYLGLPFAFAHFITSQFGPQILKAYRKGFVASPDRSTPEAAVAVAVVCADTDEKADRLARPAVVSHVRRGSSERGPLLDPDAAGAVPLTELERARADQYRSTMVVGSPARVADRLVGLAAAFGVSELIVLTVCHDPADRLRSYELLAGELPAGRFTDSS